MTPGLRTLLRRLTNISDDSVAAGDVHGEQLPRKKYLPPRVQPYVPSNPSFHGRDRFTTEELICQRLDRSERMILLEHLDYDPAYPDVSRYAGDWGPPAPPFSWNGHAARMCDKWRHSIEDSMEAESMEDMMRAERMERRVVRGLEPEFTRAVDKKEFANRMFVQLGWREGEGPTLPPAGLGQLRRRSSVAGDDEPLEERVSKRRRPITEWPSVFLPPTSAKEPSADDRTISSFHCVGQEQQYKEPPDLPHSKHYEAIKKHAKLTVRDRYDGEGIEEAFDLRQLAEAVPHPTLSEDNSYAKPNFSSSSVYSRPTASSGPGRRKESWKLFDAREPEPLGPSLLVPFSWPQMPLNPSATRRNPTLSPSPRSFQSISKDKPVHAAPKGALPRSATAPLHERKGRIDVGFEGFEPLVKRHTVAVGVERDKVPLGEQIRKSKARRERAEREEGERADPKKRKGGGGWLSRFR